MNKIIQYLGIILLGMTLVYSSNAQSNSAKTFKIGVADVEKIVKELPEALQADQALKDMQKSFQDSLYTMQNSLVARAETYQKQKSMMTADKQKAEEEALKAAEADLYKFREDKTNEMNDKREIYLAPIRSKVSDAIQVVAKDEGLAVIIDKNSGSVLYSEEKYDITFKVIDKLKRGNK